MTWNAEIVTDDVLETLERTRTIRFALESLEENLSGDLVSDDLKSELKKLRKKIAEMEREELRVSGHREYMILAPKSHIEHFGSDAVAAMRTLDELGLVIPLYDF